MTSFFITHYKLLRVKKCYLERLVGGCMVGNSGEPRWPTDTGGGGGRSGELVSAGAAADSDVGGN